MVRATGVGHYVREFMAYALTRKMLREQGALLCDNMVSLDAYRHWFDLAESERRPDLLWLTARLDEGNRVCIKAHLIECKVAQRSDQHLLKARVQITNGLRVLMAAFEPRNPASREDSRPDQRYWWLQLHRLVASKTEVEASRQADVLSALERLAEGDYSIEWDASVFAFWSDDPGTQPVKAGAWRVAEVGGLLAGVYEFGSEFVRRLAVAEPSVARTWAEWEVAARKQDVNVCDALNDVEVPPDQDDDEDAPPWIEQEEGEVDETGATGDESTEPEQAPEVEADEQVESEEHGQPELAPAAALVGTADVGPGGGQATAVPVPPVIDADAVQVPISSVTGIPDRVLLGKTISGGRPVFWEFGHRELANRHMLVFGTSGMGKTYALQCLLSELGRMKQNSLIIDYTDGFICGSAAWCCSACWPRCCSGATRDRT